MQDKDIYPENNAFFSRGCCAVPNPQEGNEQIAKGGCSKLDVYNWLKDIETGTARAPFECVEVRFKNSRKDFFRINKETGVQAGDIVAVEASPGHDIGIVSLTGDLVRLQMVKKGVDPRSENIKRIYRKARNTDIEKWVAAVSLEKDTLIKTRQIIARLGLGMKLNDIEYQGDRTKAIFYYTADDRVDFRELIKILAEEFKVRIEMRQIGVRQEAARMGGIGSCGRELCCSSYISGFTSVSTTAARIQQLSLNPQKLAGQCGKLKCCLNFETDQYIEELNKFPDNQTVLKTKKGNAMYHKTDVFKGLMWYFYENDFSSLMPVHFRKVKKVIDLNRKGKTPDSLEEFSQKEEKEQNGGYL